MAKPIDAKKLAAFRVLDQQVLQKVMIDLKTGKPKWSHPPFYASSIDDAWDVVEEMFKRGKNTAVKFYWNLMNELDAKKDDCGLAKLLMADYPAEAICKAAIKTVES